MGIWPETIQFKRYHVICITSCLLQSHRDTFEKKNHFQEGTLVNFREKKKSLSRKKNVLYSMTPLHRILVRQSTSPRCDSLVRVHHGATYSDADAARGTDGVPGHRTSRSGGRGAGCTCGFHLVKRQHLMTDCTSERVESRPKQTSAWDLLLVHTRAVIIRC